MRFKFAFLIVALAVGGLVPLRAQPVASVSVDVNTLGNLIPGNFEGISLQFDPSPANYFRGMASSPGHVFGGASAPNLVFYQLIKNLGQGTLRTNSGAASEPCWNSSAAPYPEACPHPVTEDIVRGYARASAATGWGIIVEINLAQDSAPWALQFGKAFAKAVDETPGSKLLGFEIGNEPDLYTGEMLFGRKRIRPPGYSWRDLVKEWKRYIKVFKSNPITAKVPLVGPAYDSGGWTTPSLGPFLKGVGPMNFRFATVHYYPHNVCEGQDVHIGDLLSASSEDAYLRKAGAWVQAARAQGLSLVLGETNSIACEGEKGVSDVFASAIWGLDWLFANFNVGMRGVYFHLNNSYYSPVFVTTYRNPDDGSLHYANFVAPLYYAMYAFATQAENRHLLPVRIRTDANIQAYAVRASRESPVNLFIINKDLHASGTVLVTPSTRMGEGRLLVMKAPSLESRRVSYGGATFDNHTGQLGGKPETTTVTPDPSGGYRIRLANSSIAVLTIHP